VADQANQGLLSPWLRKRRLVAASPWLSGRVLDYGCGSGALADEVDADRYLGYDIDATSVDRARLLHPLHTFTLDTPSAESFDTVASLAVIEHLRQPDTFLRQLAGMCKRGGRIVLTTPNPLLDPVHHLGAKFGLFSHDASEEHVSLLNRKALADLASSSGLGIVRYTRFLLGANQLLVLQK
jgi:2-polyprenyl-3-methyl-5-hydroxy-6-metoxy-1,4-benzoquinol methylase